MNRLYIELALGGRKMDTDRIEFLKNNIIEIDEKISLLYGEIMELQGYKTKCIDELKKLGCELDPYVLYYPESGCIIV